MIAVVSPAKSLDFEKKVTLESTQPRLLKQSHELIDVLKEKSPEEIGELMSLSENLAELNTSRYQTYKKTHNEKNSKQALYAFQGDVYQGLEAHTFNDQDLEFAQHHLRILSGLYGLLRPLDIIQPYRLEMGTKLAFDDYKTLYQYWDDKILKLLIKDLKAQGDNIIVNLASIEYFKSINQKKIPATVIDVDFKDFKNGKYKIISFFAKRARGLMSRYIIQNKITKIEDLKAFDYDGYYFDEEASTEKLLAFKRR